MKKTLFAALAIAAMASCSNEEIVEATNKEVIAFDNAFVDNSTRAHYDPSYTNNNLFSGFNVYGFVEKASLFDGTLCQGTVADGATEWGYQGTQYWIPGANYNFCAIAPATVTDATTANWTKTSCSVANDGTINTTLSFTNNGTQDLLYAEHEQIQGKLTGNEKVDFTFRHLLSRVKFTFKNGYNATGATLKVKNIKINNPYKTANVALTAINTNWTDQAIASDFTLDFGNALSEQATSATADETIEYSLDKSSFNALFLIPGNAPSTAVEGTDGTTTNVVGYNVTFDVVLLVNGTEIKTYNREVVVNFNPEPGKSYNISTEITASNIDPDNAFEPIQFTVNALPGWGNDNTVNM